MNRFRLKFAVLPVAVPLLLTACFQESPPTLNGPGADRPALAASQTQAGWQFFGNPGSAFAFKTAGREGFSLDPGVDVPGGKQIIRWVNGRKVDTIPGGLLHLDISKDAELWGVNDAGWIFRHEAPITGLRWKSVGLGGGRFATRIAAGLNGVIYALSTEDAPGGGGKQLYRWSGRSDIWTNIPAGLLEIDVDNNGDVWGVNDQGWVFRLPGGNPQAPWESHESDFTAIDIGVGNGKVIVLTSVTLPNGNALKLWQGDHTWTDIRGSMTSLFTDVTGRAWGTDNSLDIFYRNP